MSKGAGAGQRRRTKPAEVIVPTVICPDCGDCISIFAEIEHDLKCPGPVKLVFTEDGIFGEVWE